jgi:microcystin-dependent protein
MTLRRTLLLLGVALLAMMASKPAMAQEPFLGEIRFVGFNFAPKGWSLCDGSVLPINQNQALFSLLGTSFGGDGKSTFALPDMRGRVPVGTGQGPSLSNRTIGDQGGAETVALTLAQMPKHRHALRAASGSANSKAPSGNVLANSSSAAIYSTQAAGVSLDATSLTTQGSGQAHENMPPFLGMTCIIALQGIFPSRD